MTFDRDNDRESLKKTKMIFSLLKNKITNQEITHLIDELQEKYIELEKLIKQLDEYDIAYYIENKSIIEDVQYDSLKIKMQLMIAEVIDKINHIEALSKNDSDKSSIKKSFSQIKRELKKRACKVGVKPGRKFKKVKHRRPMLSLSNCFSKEDIALFMNRLGNVDKLTCELKIDGISFSALYENGQLQLALTRGDGKIGEDITLNIKQIKDLPYEISYKGSLEVRGEIYIDKETFVQLSDFATARNAASGSVRQLDPLVTRERNLKYFIWDADFPDMDSHYARMLCAEELGFSVNEYKSIASNLSEMISFYEKVALIRSNLDFDIDGVVYKVDDRAEQENLGCTASSPRWATAYKFPAAEAITHIIDIVIQVGKSGVLTPVAILEPINIGGALISRTTLHNAAEIKRHGYSIGDLVKIVRSGDVIPKITGIVTKGNGDQFVMPMQCQICNSQVIDDETFTHKLCSGGWVCKGQMIGRLKHFTSRDTFNIVGLGHKQIEYFVANDKIKTFSDIFRLENNNYLDPLQNKHGWGRKSVSELFQSISSCKKIEFHKFLYSLSIPHVGSETALLLAKKFINYANLIKAINRPKAAETLQSINGIGSQIAESVIKFLRDECNLEIISDLLNYIEVIQHEETIISKTFAFTGTLTTITRSRAEELVIKIGDRFSNSITKKVHYLVIGDKPSSSKIYQAKKLNIQLLSQKEFLERINFYKFSS